MQTAKETHPLDVPLSNVPSTPAQPKPKAKGKRVDDGLIDPAKTEAAARVIAGSDGGKPKAKTAKAKAKASAKRPAKASAKKAKAKSATQTRPGLKDPMAGTLTAKMISMLQRPNGATITEIVRTRPNLRGATPGATISAEISRLKPHWNVVKIGDGKNDARRFRITGRRK